MKKTVLILMLFLFSASPVLALSPVGDQNIIPFYRLYNPSIGDHFYTTSDTEAQISSKYGYRSEWFIGYMHRNLNENNQPLYRLYNPSLGDHFYTISENEKNISIAQFGYVYEGIAGYVDKQRSLGTHALLRLYNPKTHDHFYVMNYPGAGAAEAQAAVSQYGYVLEGTMGYIHHSNSPDTGAISYIVTFNDDVADVQDLVDSLQKKYGFSVSYVYTSAIKGFSAFLNSSQFESLKQEPQVKFIEEDQTVTIN